MKQPLPLALVFLALLSIPGIAASQAPPRRVGMMTVAGNNAFLNGRPVRTHDPVPINDGDYVSTGADTSVLIGLTADGYAGAIQLDQNTDPNLVIAARCIVMRLLKGQALVNAKNICLGSPNISGVTRSVVNLKADDPGGKGTVVTVIEGQLEVESPAPMTIAGAERLVVLPDGTVHQYAIDAAEIARTTQWTQRYDFRNPVPEGHGSTWKKVGTVVGAGALLCVFGVICDKDDDHDDHDHDGSNDKPAQSVACCTYGDGVPNVMQTNAQDCARKGGTAYPSPQAASNACKVAPAEPVPPATVQCCKYNDGAVYRVETTVQECSGSQDWVIKPGMEAQCSAVR